MFAFTYLFGVIYMVMLSGIQNACIRPQHRSPQANVFSLYILNEHTCNS